jgi:CheY-like chemotaxis protein
MSNPRFDRVLLIDDNEINNVMHERLLEISGFAGNLVVKQGAVEALEYLKDEVKDGSIAPEVIFLDIRMPIMDGFGFLAEFENLPPYIRDKAKIIMLTSSLDEEDNAKAASNPRVISFLVKPLSLDKLNSLKV